MKEQKQGARQVLIIGGGFGGLACARQLAFDPRFEVTLVDKANHHLFQPLLYQVATASLSSTDIARTLRQLFRSAENVRVIMDEIVEIHLDGKTATGKEGTVYHWDSLVLASGARTSFFGHDDWEPHLMGLKSLADAREIRARVLANLEVAEREPDALRRRKLMTVAIVGGGPTGVELAGAFVDLARRSMRNEFRSINPCDLRVVLVEGGHRLLAAFDEDQSEYVKKRMDALGVEAIAGRQVTAVEEGVLHLDDGSQLEAGAIIWAAGVEATSLTRQLGVELADRGGHVTPEADLTLPGNPDVFVVGDVVRMKDCEGKPVPGVAPAASQMGTHVAKVLRARAAGKSGEKLAFRYFDKGLMAIVGKNAAVVKSGHFRLRGFPAWLVWLFVHILFLVGFRNKLVVLLGWASAYIHNEPGARIIGRTSMQK